MVISQLRTGYCRGIHAAIPDQNAPSVNFAGYVTINSKISDSLIFPPNHISFLTLSQDSSFKKNNFINELQQSKKLNYSRIKHLSLSNIYHSTVHSPSPQHHHQYTC
jgi:hypothetical protein